MVPDPETNPTLFEPMFRTVSPPQAPYNFPYSLELVHIFVCSNALGGQTASQAPESIVTIVEVSDTANPLGMFLMFKLSCF